MKKKLLVFDLDGTLLKENKEIDHETRNYILELQQEGHKVVLASGRTSIGIMPYVKLLKLGDYDGYVVSNNGASVIKCRTGEEIHRRFLDIETSRKILKDMKNYEVIPLINKERYLYVEDVYRSNIHISGKEFNVIEYEARSNNYLIREVDILHTFVDFPLYKILIAANPSILDQLSSRLDIDYNDICMAMRTSDFFYEFMPMGVDKAYGVKYIMNSLKVKKDQVVVFGDSYNDISMFKLAQRSVAMGNAIAELKNIATMISDTNENKGILKALKKVIE